MSSSTELKSEMGNWLQTLAPWDSFFTGTWKRPVTLDGVLYGMRRYLKKIEAMAGVPVYAYFGVERGNKGGLLHVHALIGNISHVRNYCGDKKQEGPCSRKIRAAFFTRGRGDGRALSFTIQRNLRRSM